MKMHLSSRIFSHVAPVALALVGLSAPHRSLAEDQPKPRVDFTRDIRPLLSDKCFSCHGPSETKRKADLRLDTRDGLLTGELQPVVPGKPDDSELFLRITSDDGSEKMPPPKSRKTLKPEEIDLIRRWIAQGAPWRAHWSYAPLLRPKVPDVADAKWPVNDVDRFIGQRLDREKLRPSPDAGRITLMRRLSFDLTGLPPTAKDVAAFVADRSGDALGQVVDRLLRSPHYGERMAVHWLDLVRYADTVGYHGDQDHNISPYRDYVIKSFNDNLPFDRFTAEQLAGDLLSEPTQWQIIATGYNRLLQTSHEGGVQAKEYLTKYAADRVRNLSAVWLGTTLGCAECHEHKFDPFPQRDFYSLAAFFADLDEMGTFKGTDRLPTHRPPEVPVRGLPELNKLAELDKAIAELESQPNNNEEGDTDLEKRLTELKKQREEAAKQTRVSMITKTVEPRTIRILPRGNWLDESGEIVQPAIPEIFGKIEKEGRANRLDLAKWLVSRDNPLVARVFVNRLWKLFFGTGLAASLDDLGSQGAAPVHPELLDWLAVEFIEGGWDVKHTVRLLVTSRTYRQSSLESPSLRQRDPQNRLLARQSRFRLDAEFVRDNALSVSGLLVQQVGGRSVKPYQPAGYYQHLNFPKRVYKHDTGPEQYRRALYTHWQRIFLHPMLKAFDAPSREECAAERAVSNTPLAALVLLNDPTFVEAARVFAARIVKEGGDETQQRIRWAWRQTLSRSPTAQEVTVLKQLYDHGLGEYADDPTAAGKLVGIGLAPKQENVDPGELAAWTTVARALFNLNETITRN